MDRGVGHGRSLASAATAGSGGVASPAWSLSSSPTATRRPAPNSIAAWPGWDADGRLRHRRRRWRASRSRARGRRSTCGSATATRSARTRWPRSRPRACRSNGRAADKDESDTELAVRAALRREADGLVIVGALGGRRIDHALANIGLLAMPELAGRAARSSTRGRGSRSFGHPGPMAAPVELPLPGGSATSCRSCRSALASTASRRGAWPIRSSDEPLAAGPARGLSNVRTAADAAVTVRRGLLLVVESPATL